MLKIFFEKMLQKNLTFSLLKIKFTKFLTGYRKIDIVEI